MFGAAVSSKIMVKIKCEVQNSGRIIAIKKWTGSEDKLDEKRVKRFLIKRPSDGDTALWPGVCGGCRWRWEWEYIVRLLFYNYRLSHLMRCSFFGDCCCDGCRFYSSHHIAVNAHTSGCFEAHLLEFWNVSWLSLPFFRQWMRSLQCETWMTEH